MSNCTLNLKKVVKGIKDGRSRQGRRYSSEVMIWILILGLCEGGKNLTQIYELFSWQKSLTKLIEKITGEKLFVWLIQH